MYKLAAIRDQRYLARGNRMIFVYQLEMYSTSGINWNWPLSAIRRHTILGAIQACNIGHFNLYLTLMISEPVRASSTFRLMTCTLQRNSTDSRRCSCSCVDTNTVNRPMSNTMQFFSVLVNLNMFRTSDCHSGRVESLGYEQVIVSGCRCTVRISLSTSGLLALWS